MTTPRQFPVSFHGPAVADRIRPRRDYYTDVVPQRLFHAYPASYTSDAAALGIVGILTGTYALDKYLQYKRNASARDVGSGASRLIKTNNLPRRSYGPARQAWRDVYANLKHLGLRRTADREIEATAQAERRLGWARRIKTWNMGNDRVVLHIVNRNNNNGWMPNNMNIV